MVIRCLQLVLAVIVSVAAAVPVCRAAASLDDIRASAGSIRSVNARFVQEKHMKILVKPLVSEGIFIYQSPDSLRFEYLTPVSILLMHRKSMSRYIRKGGELVRDNSSAMGSMQVVMDEITRWMKGDFDTTLFDAVVKDDPEPGRIVLTPKEKAMAGFIQSIEMGLSDRPGVFRCVIIREDSDSFTRLLFEDVVVNAPVDPAVFKAVQ